MLGTEPRAQVRIRPLTIEDAPAVARLCRALGGAETEGDWVRFFTTTPRDHFAVGGFARRALVGYAAGEIAAHFGMSGPVGWVQALGIALEHRGHQLGRSLAVELLARFRRAGATRAYTLVPLHDRSLDPFFRELGFRDEPISCLGVEL